MKNPTNSESLALTDHPSIVKTPGTCGGKPRIAGHRIRVQDIVIWHERQRMSPAEIIDQYPSLNLDEIEAAISYFHAHREEIESLLKEGDDLADRINAQGISVLIRTPRKLDAQDHPFSS